MNTALLLFGFFICFSSVIGGPMQLAEKILKTIRKCSRSHHLKFEDIQRAIRKGQLPTTEEGKCFVACTLEEFDMIKDNKFNAEGSYKLNEMRFNNEEELKKANEITAACEKELEGEHENSCDFGITVANCGLQKSKSVGIIHSQLW